MPTSDGKLRVLSLCGGGIRGLLSARILVDVEKALGAPLYTHFDMICGVSTGSIIAAGLTKRNPLSAQELVDLYLRKGKDIFSQSFWSKIKNLGNNIGPKYDGQGLRDALRATLGDARLEDALVPTFIPAYGIEARDPVFFKSWLPAPVPHSLVDVCVASSAGPTYFPPACVNGAWYIDGGTVCNNPSVSGVIEAAMLYKAHARDCIVLSIGTGIAESPIPHAKAAGWGNLQWVQPLIEIFMDGVSDLSHYQMADLLPDAQYLHLQPSLTEAQAAMDNTNPLNMGELLAIAQNTLASNQKPLLALLGRLSS
jgi:hypothetical protein